MADTNIKWNGTPIDSIERDSLSLDRINENGTIREMVDTINANFLNIAKHGGGPAGIDGTDGSNGVDGSNAEYIYALCDEMKPDVQYPTNTYERTNLFNSVKSAGSYTYKGVTWFDNAQPISPDYKNEYVWTRIKRGTSSTEWYYASEPVLWSHWGETGKDGDGVEYIFLASSNELTSIALNTSLLKIENMDDFQKVIFNIDDFYPGKKWFSSGNNKQKARLAISKKGLEISDSTFDTRWGQYFNFCNDTYSWTDEPTGTGPSVLYEYVSIRKSTTDENDIKTWGNFSTPALWSNYNLPTKTVIIYCNLNEDITPESPVGGWVDMSTGKLITNKSGYELTPDYWKDTNDDAEENQITWMSTGVFDYTGKNTYWSSPVRVTGRDGKNGEDGTLIEFIYALTTSGTQPDYPAVTDKTQLDTLFDAIEESTESPKYSTYGSTKWYDRAQAISADIPVEYMAQRSKNPDETEWTYTKPIIWAHWGEDGTDGDGVEYIFATTKTDSNTGLVLPVYSSLNDSQKKIFQIDDFVPSTEWFNKSKSKQKAQEILGESFSNTEWNNQYGFNVSSGWSDNPVEVNPSTPYQWVSIRRSHADEHTGDRFWEDFSTPVLWNSYGKRTRTFVVYCNMSDETTPQSPTGGWWDTTSDGLWMSKTNSGEYKSNALQSGTPNYTSYIGYWSDNNIDVRGTITWISTGEFNNSIDENGSNNISWSKPFRITGETGEPGADGSNREFVYALCDDKDSLKYPQNSSNTVKNKFFDDIESAGTNGYAYEGTTWYDHPQGVANENGKRTEWVWSRSKPAGDSETTQWETSPIAVIWSHWGEDGTDGDGVEYIFTRSTQKPLDDIDKPYKVSELSTDAQKVIYNINDFFPGEGWFTSDNKAIAKKAIKDAGISITDTQFNTQWNNKFNLIKTSSDPNVIVCQWWDNPRGVDLEHPYEFVSIRKSSIDENGKKVWGDFSDPALWSEYPIKSRTFIVYCNVDEGTTPNKPLEGDFTWDVQNDRLVKSQNSSTIWSDTDVDVPGKIAWLCSGLFAENGNVISWSAPFRITGEQGKKGADGSTVEFVYALSDTMPNFPDSTVSYTDRCNFFDSVERTPEGFVYNGTKWFDNPQGIIDEDGKRKEWVWSRNKSAGDSGAEWTFPESPVIWAHWGEDGTDGDGVEYMFLLGNFDTYNSPTENEWNTFFSSNFTNNNVSDTAKYVYATSDFLPTTAWFDNTSNSSAVQERMEADGKTFDNTVWNNLRNAVNSRQLGSWEDNPGSVSSSKKYQYVSIRKMSDGEWGAFSYPKLWSKYATIKFKSIAFAATTFDTDLSGCTVTGGSFSNPIPTTTKDSRNNTVNVVWTDGPQPDASTGKTQIWMTSANVSEDSTSALVWSAPQKMTDTSDLQVEWSSTDKTLAELASINNSLTASKYNFGVLLQSNSYSENAAELAWRTLMQDDFNISFNDNSENAILMATSQLKNGVWTDWKITRVKGEKGDAGTSINIKGKIIFESYLTSGTTYNYTNANNRKGTHTPTTTPEEGDLLIVYPYEVNENDIYYGDSSDSGKLYMWKYTNNAWVDYNSEANGEETGNTYVSPNGHLILWDGDSWSDVGNIVGPEGKSYTIAVKYANDGTNGKVEITNDLEIPNAKWIGICVYEEGTTIPPITDAKWKWSLFKGQDGYGYEYIFKPTSTNDSASIPKVPQMPSGGNWYTTPNIIPDGWVDDPIEPTSTNKYIWMCWRKFDHNTQKWTDFMGVNNGTSVTTNAKLWHFYVTDGRPGEQGEAGNGYQYKYIRYDNSVSYGSTTCTVTNASSDNPTFKIGNITVSSTNSAQGVDSDHTYEYRSERYGHAGSWSDWSDPVIIARYLDDSDIKATVQAEVSTATSGIENSIRKSFQSTIDDVDNLKGYINPSTGLFSGTISEGTKTQLLSGYIKTNELSGEIENVKLSGFGTDAETGTTRSFSEWVDYEEGQFTSVNQQMDALSGSVETAVNSINGKAESSALTKLEADTHAQFAKLENTVANGQFLTDDDGYLLVDELTSTTWYSQKSYLGNAGTTTWIMSEVFENSGASYNFAPEVDSVDDLHNYDYSKWMIILRKPFDFSVYTYLDYTTTSYKDLLSNNITVHLNKNTGEYTIDDINPDIDNKLNGFYNPFTSSNVEPGVIIYAVVDLNNNSYSTEDDVNYICSQLSWKVGLSDGYDGSLNNYGEKLCEYAYAKTNNIFITPIYQYDGTTYSNSYDDVIMHAKLYGKYGYTLAVDKNDNVYKPKVAGVSASDNTPVHFVPKSTPFETIWNYFKNGTTPETTVIDDIMLDTDSEYYVLKHFKNISSEPYSYTLDITDNLKNDDKNEVSFSYDTATTPIFTNTHKYTGTEFSNNNGFRQITVGVNTSTVVRYLTDSFQFLTTSANDTINLTCDYSLHYRNDTGITVTVSYWYDNETTKKNISFINDSSQRSSYPVLTSVSGYVYDINDGEPIIGATVSVVGTSTIATTDTNGHYELTGVQGISAKSLKFEYISMETIQTTVNGYNEINVYLSEGNDGYVVKNDTSGSGDDSTYGHYSKSITKNLFDGITIEPYRQLNVEITVQVSPVMDNVDFKYKVESTNKITENGFNASTLSLSGEYSQDVIVSPSQNKTDTLLGEDKEDLGDGYANTLFTLKSRYQTGTREDTDFIFYSIKSIDKNIRINLDIVLEKGTLTNAGMITAYGTFKYVVIPMHFDEIDLLQIVSNLEHEGSSEFLFDERYWANDWDVLDVVDNYITIGQSLKSSTILDFNNAYDDNGEYYFTVLQVYETNNGTINSGTFYSRLYVSAVNPYFNWSTDGYTRTINHRYCNNIIDQVNVKISDRSIIEKFNENNRRRALDKYGNPTSNYIDVIDSDRDKLIYSVSELSSISQMVSKGIASTSIVTTTEDGAAIFYEQVDENGSKIYMNANTIGIYSDYFSLDNSGLEMRGNLLAKDENGIITAGVIGDNTADNDVKFFAGTNSEMQDMTKAPFRVYEDGSIYANQGYFGTAKITASGIGVISNDGFVLIGDKGIEIRDKYDNYSIISPSEITLSAALKKRNAYIFDVWTWDDDSKLKTLKKDYGVYPTSLINEAFKECDIINTFNQGDTFTIPSSISLIGRHITLMGGSALCSMVISAVKASGVGYSISMGNVADTYQFTDDCKFYENGGVSSSLKLSNEGVDLVGVGFGNNFKGFVVTNRFNVNTNYNYGADLRCLGMFSIDGSTIKSYTFNGQSGTISSSSSQYVTILTPFKINDSYIDKILVNISSESGNSTGITYNYSLSTDSNKMLSITVYSSSISKKFKLTVFNFADVESLVNDPSTPPGVTKKEYKPSYNTSYYTMYSSLSISYNSGYTYNIRLTVNGSTKKVEYELQSGSAYFTFASGSKTTSGNTTVNIGAVSAKSDNYTDSYRSGVIKVTLHSTTSGSGSSNKKTIITIPLEQGYYVEPSYGGNS